jgi:hypothetical protein
VNPFKERLFSVAGLAIAWVSLWVMWADPNPVELFKWSEEEFWQEKVYGKKSYDVIFVGDSRVYRGISPEVLHRRMPEWNFFNFGFSSGRIDRMLLQATSRRLNPEGAKILVLPLSHCSLFCVENEHYLSIAKPSLLHSLPPEWAVRFRSISERRRWWKQPSPETWNYQQKFYRDSGWVGSWTVKNDYESALESYRKYFLKRSRNGVDLQLFDKNLKFCRKKGVRVIAFRMPSCEAMEHLEDEMGGIDFGKVKEIVLENGATWFDVPSDLPLHSYDSSHLDMPSALWFSNYLGEKIQSMFYKSEAKR